MLLIWFSGSRFNLQWWRCPLPILVLLLMLLQSSQVVHLVSEAEQGMKVKLERAGKIHLCLNWIASLILCLYPSSKHVQRPTQIPVLSLIKGTEHNDALLAQIREQCVLKK